MSGRTHGSYHMMPGRHCSQSRLTRFRSFVSRELSKDFGIYYKAEVNIMNYKTRTDHQVSALKSH